MYIFNCTDVEGVKPTHRRKCVKVKAAAALAGPPQQRTMSYSLTINGLL